MDISLRLELGPGLVAFLERLVTPDKPTDQELVDGIVADYEAALKRQKEELTTMHTAKLQEAANKAPVQKRQDPTDEELAALEELRKKAAEEAENLHKDDLEPLPNCLCGCGKPVLKPTSKYRVGHAGGRRKNKPQKSSLKLTSCDLAVMNGLVKCPEEDRLISASGCDDCTSLITRLKDGVTKQTFLRCGKAHVEVR